MITEMYRRTHVEPYIDAFGQQVGYVATAKRNNVTFSGYGLTKQSARDNLAKQLRGEYDADAERQEQ